MMALEWSDRNWPRQIKPEAFSVKTSAADTECICRQRSAVHPHGQQDLSLRLEQGEVSFLAKKEPAQNRMDCRIQTCQQERYHRGGSKETKQEECKASAWGRWAQYGANTG